MGKIKNKQGSEKARKVAIKHKQKVKSQNVKKIKIIPHSDPLNDSDLSNDEESSNSELLNSDSDENGAVADVGDELEENDSDNDSADEAEKHKRDLKKLKESDPEFYQFLQENDRKLLEFNLSDEDSDDERDEKVTEVHKPSDTLDVASDESDFEVIGIIISALWAL